MHILVVNDDGPPSTQLSPYIRPFVNTLQSAGHLVSVAIPASSRSWISKSHLREARLKASYVYPDNFREDGTWEDTDNNNKNNQLPSETKLQNGTTTENNNKEWPWAIITNGTPASCTQLGLFNLFRDRPAIDLVIAGPNHGRNASTIYNLSSGTVGGALEAATCGKRGIALSFGSKDPQPTHVIDAAARLSVRVIEYLCCHWDPRVEVYNLNVPMRDDVEGRPVRYTRAFQNYWARGCLYAEVSDGDRVVDDVDCSIAVCNGNGNTDGNSNGLVSKSKVMENGHYHDHVGPTSMTTTSHVNKDRHFIFSPDLSDMKRGLQASQEGTDAHTVLNGCTSVTPLLANLWHVPGLDGELEL